MWGAVRGGLAASPVIDARPGPETPPERQQPMHRHRFGYQGGHTGFFESRPVQRFVDSALVQSGLIDA